MSKATPKSQAIDGPLYRLLSTKFPSMCDGEGRLQVVELAGALKMSSEGVYRWLRSDEISKRGLNRLVKVGKDNYNADNPLTEDDLRPFL